MTAVHSDHCLNCVGVCRLPFQEERKGEKMRWSLPFAFPRRAQGREEMAKAAPTPGKLLLSPADHTLIMIDHQSQMAFATKSIDAVMLRNNAALVAHSYQRA